jgi:uncharacterized membrane protein YkvA (DUF1232 family)
MTTDHNENSTTKGNGVFGSFIDMVRELLKHLDINSHLFVEIMKDDLLPLRCRSLAAGVLLYLNLPADIINDKLKILGLIDDVVVMVTGLTLIIPLMPEERKIYYRNRYDTIANIDDYQRILQAALGMLWERLVQFVEGLRHRLFHKMTAEQVAQTDELREELHDKTMIFVAELNLSPEKIDSGLAELPPPEKVIGLLGSGLDEMQKREQGQNNLILPTSVVKRFLSSGEVSKSGEKE